MDHRQHFTLCCFGHYDLNSHFKNLNISNTFLTLGEPHKPKHALSTLSSKHDSMCHGKICIEQNIITQNPEIHLIGNSKFSESSKLSLWPFLNCFTYTNTFGIHSQLTMNNGN